MKTIQKLHQKQIETLKNAGFPRHYRLSVAKLVEASLARKEAVLAENGALTVFTGKYTGRSPEDRYVVDTEKVHPEVAWGIQNHPIRKDVFDRIFTKMTTYLAQREVFVFQGYVGADPQHRLSVEVISETAYQSLFAHHMFIRLSSDEAENTDAEKFWADATVLAAPGFELNPILDSVHSEAGVLLDLERKLVLIINTRYCGEIKKSIFSLMNYLMPVENVLPMHCSANKGTDGNTALFFGLSGTGKTTLSTSPDRQLIGDDEHGWGPQGIFNFEGGCYAKAIKLSVVNEPDIYKAIRFGTVAENIVLHPETRLMNFEDETITQNTRVAYPINYIDNAELTGQAGHPNTILFLTADATGVLPPVSKLTSEQAQYHFISGYTSKLAGTERGIVEPKAAFSTCFGAPFMVRPAWVYAKLLTDRIGQHAASVYLVNTGWQGGPYGVGQRISIPLTRNIVNAALDGRLERASYTRHPVFNVLYPTACEGLPSEKLDPRGQWPDKNAYDQQARALARQFQENFKTFPNVEHLISAGPVAD